MIVFQLGKKQNFKDFETRNQQISAVAIQQKKPSNNKYLEGQGRQIKMLQCQSDNIRYNVSQLNPIRQEQFQGFEIGEQHLGAVIVVQECFGVNIVHRKIALEIHHKTGLRVLVPDLYDGKVYDKIGDAIAYLRKDVNPTFISFGQKIDAAIHYLRNSGSKKVGYVGFSLGGFFAYYCAQNFEIDCSTAFYATPEHFQDLFQIEKMKKDVPFQGFYGKLDNHKSGSHYESGLKYEKILKDAGIQSQFYFIEDAGHSYMNAICDEGIEGLKANNFPIPPQNALDKTWDLMTSFQKSNLT